MIHSTSSCHTLPALAAKMASTAPITIFTVHSVDESLLNFARNQEFKVEGEPGTVVADNRLSPAQSTTTVDTEERTPAPSVLPFLRITTAYQPKSVGIFVFGRDPDSCDIQLGQGRESGISRRHFAIEINFNYGSLILKSFGKHSTNMGSPSLGNLNLVRAQRALPDNEDVIVKAGKIAIWIRLPVRSQESCARWVAYCARFTLVPPPVEDLNLVSETSTAATVLGYILGRRLGSGTSATVYRAIHGVTGDVVAFKQFHTTDAKRHSDRNFLDIRHPNIVDFLCFAQFGGHQPPILVMRLVDGPDLALEHEHLPLTILEVRLVLGQLAAALDYLHALGIAHRDVKPANVLVKSRTPVHVLLTDFDLASASSSLRDKCGTLYYVAPEVLSGNKYTSKVDMWSLGMLALEMAFGLPRYPRSRDDWLATVEAHISCQPPSLVLTFISDLLRPEPDHRLAAPDALRHDFFTVNMNDHGDNAPTAVRQSPGQHTARSFLQKQGRLASTVAEDLHNTLPWGQDLTSPQSLPDTELWLNQTCLALEVAQDKPLPGGSESAKTTRRINPWSSRHHEEPSGFPSSGDQRRHSLLAESSAVERRSKRATRTGRSSNAKASELSKPRSPKQVGRRGQQYTTTYWHGHQPGSPSLEGNAVLGQASTVEAPPELQNDHAAQYSDSSNNFMFGSLGGILQQGKLATDPAQLPTWRQQPPAGPPSDNFGLEADDAHRQPPQSHQEAGQAAPAEAVYDPIDQLDRQWLVSPWHVPATFPLTQPPDLGETDDWAAGAAATTPRAAPYELNDQQVQYHAHYGGAVLASFGHNAATPSQSGLHGGFLPWPAMDKENVGHDSTRPADHGDPGYIINNENDENGNPPAPSTPRPGPVNLVASHLSTRSVQTGDGLIYVVIGRQRVSMRTSDHHFNTAEIFAAARASDNDRVRYRNQLRHVISKEGSQLWVPFSHGAQLCQKLGLDVQTLLEHGPSAADRARDDDDHNEVLLRSGDGRVTAKKKKIPQGYLVLGLRDGRSVACQPSIRTVNAAHLVRNQPGLPRKLREYLAKNPDLARTRIQGNCLIIGTYIGLADVSRVCVHFGLNDPTQEIESAWNEVGQGNKCLGAGATGEDEAGPP
ncbi:hypothetical protein RB596_000322 [Gaeumannomyces avenae]